MLGISLFFLELLLPFFLGLVVPERHNFQVIVFDRVVAVVHVEMFQALTDFLQFAFVRYLDAEQRQSVQHDNLDDHMVVGLKPLSVLRIEKKVPVFEQKVQDLHCLPKVLHFL